MNKLLELQRRKAELKTQIEQQRSDLKNTFLEIRAEIEPVNLFKKAVRGMFGFSKNKPGEENSKISEQIQTPLAFLVDMFVRDPRLAFFLKLLAESLVGFKNQNLVGYKNQNLVSFKNQRGLNWLRRSVSSLRSQLRKPTKDPETTTVQPDL